MRPHLRLERAKSILERRLFLKAVGLGLAAPVAFKLAKSATAAPTGAPKRFLVMYLPHGVAMEHWNPAMGGDGTDPTNFALDMTGESSLGPLEPYKKWVNVYQGFSYADLGGTHEGIVNILSGANTLDTTTPRITLEHVIAKGLGVQPLIVGACAHQVYEFDLHGMLFWDGSAAVEPQKDPSAVFDKLFGGQTTSTPTQSADDQLRSAMLDLTTAELNDLKTSVASLTNEQTKLQSHLDAIAALKAGGSMSGANTASCTAQTLPSVEAVRKASAGQVLNSSHSNDYFYQEENFRAIFQAQLDLVAKALICNAAQVIGLMPMYATCEFDFSFIGGSLGGCSGWGHHGGLSHTSYQQSPSAMYNSPITVDNALEAPRATFGRAQRWFIDQLTTSVISLLATTPDPAASDGSMVLDNTIIYLTSEIADSQDHTRISEVLSPQLPSYLPMVSVGGGGGGLVSGQVITLPIPKQGASSPVDRPATDLYLTLAKAMGVTATFPGTTGTVTGVLA
ncbi:MAG TPA: DUF1552 domain-containing protein [Polyangiaceae bacterium]|nr:DUF1552 domain-containing protein [Polyangiaceae bacterium]